MIRTLGRFGIALTFACCALAALPAGAGSFEDAVRARWRGAWVVTEIETFSSCNGRYSNNDALYDPRKCQIELEVAIPRDLLKSKNVEEVDRLLASIASRFATFDEAQASSDWNGREADEYPDDYEITLARHSVWQAEQLNLTIDEQLDHSLVVANELAREVDGNPVYLAGFAEGARAMREWRERDCGRLVGSTAVTFRLKAPEEYKENTTWCDGYHDGQALIYNLAILSRLPACYVEVPEEPADDALAQR